MAIINTGTDQHFSCHYKKLTLPGQRNTILTSYTWKRTQSSPARRVIILVTFYLISLHLKHTDSANRAIAMSTPLVLHGFTVFLEKVLQEILHRKKGKGDKGHTAGYMN